MSGQGITIARSVSRSCVMVPRPDEIIPRPFCAVAGHPGARRQCCTTHARRSAWHHSRYAAVGQCRPDGVRRSARATADPGGSCRCRAVPQSANGGFLGNGARRRRADRRGTQRRTARRQPQHRADTEQQQKLPDHRFHRCERQSGQRQQRTHPGQQFGPAGGQLSDLRWRRPPRPDRRRHGPATRRAGELCRCRAGRHPQPCHRL